MTYDRFGETDPAEPEPGESVLSDAELAAHKARCSGWLDRDADNPVPCLRCRPHLAPEARRKALGLGDKK